MTALDAFVPALVASIILILFCYRPSRKMRLRLHRLTEKVRHRRRHKALESIRRLDLTAVRVPYHEAGHALMLWQSPYAGRGLRLTVRQYHEGLTSYAHKDRDGAQASWWILCIMLGGVAAESLRFSPRKFPGDWLDITESVAIATDMLSRETEVAAPADAPWLVPLSAGEREEAEELIGWIHPPLPSDERLRDIIAKAYLRARRVLRSKSAELDELAAFTFERRYASGMHVRRIAGERPPLLP